jgi:Domain of unknown function (DUF4386)
MPSRIGSAKIPGGDMSSGTSKARQAGLLYLLMVISGPVNLLYFPHAFIVHGDAAATAHKIAAGEMTYRLCIVAGLVGTIAFLFLALTLYDLFKGVDRGQARSLLVLVAVSATIGMLNAVNELAPLVILNGADGLSAFTKPQLDALALGFLHLRGRAIDVNSALWGLWLLPFGILVIKSRFLPRFIGVLLIVGCVAYLVSSFTAIVFPAHLDAVTNITLPLASPGELLAMFWLLFKRARVQTHEVEPSYA